jgi:hypothetical protein
MASQSDTLAVAVAKPAPLTVAALPHALLLEVLSRLPRGLPLDCRLRCAEVYRSWRAAADDPTLWRRLDLSPATGGLARAASDSLLRAAAARAAGRLQALDLSACGRITHEAVCAVAAENAGALVELRLAAPNTDLWRSWPRLVLSVQQLDALLQAAPLLRVLEAYVECRNAEARRLLRNEAPFGPLRMRSLHMHLLFVAGWDYVAAVTWQQSFAQDALAHAWLTGLFVEDAWLNEPAVLDALVDLALQRRLTFLELHGYGFSPACAPALARLVGGSALSTLGLHSELPTLFLDEPAAMLLGNALRANTTLTSASFTSVGLFNDAAGAAALLGALTAHPTLQKLDIGWNENEAVATGFAGYAHAPAAQVVLGAALGTLVAANSPALRDLGLSDCGLDDAGLGPLTDALAHNTHLRTLVQGYNCNTDAFFRNRLLPAVHINTSLRELVLIEDPGFRPILYELQDLVAGRGT